MTTALRFMRQREPSALAAWAVVAASLVAVGISTVTGYESRANARCQARVNNQLVVALTARAAAGDADWAALDNLIRDTASAPDDATANDLRRQYVAARTAALATRQADSLPAPPAEICG